MKRILTIVVCLCVLTPVVLTFSSCSDARQEDPAILVFSKTAGYRHASIPAGITALEQLGARHGFSVDTTEDAAHFTEDTLRQYSAVVFLNTTGDVLDKYQEADFERYIQAGGGFVGIHAAADTEYHWGWYGKMVGGYFLDHPGINDPHPNVQPGTLHVEDSTHASTRFLPDRWQRTDEWYSYRNLNEDVNVLLTIDEDSYQGGAEMGHHPMAWYHEYDGGRVFYTGLGHTDESYDEELYMQHVLEGIRYAMGEDSTLDYSQATTGRVPAANRFSKVFLSRGEFTEPTEMTILPNRDVLIAQRRGEVMLFDQSDSTLSQAGNLDVYWRTDAEGVNAEEGLMGIQADPDFEQNNHVYLFYSPADTPVNRLSRFVFSDGTLDMESETMILEFHSQRDICCHTGGSIAFDSEGLLYLSTGDNATPFNQDTTFRNEGFAPLDGRPGYEQYDARRSSGNANDLRGKILRIRVNEDGSYDIPEGNLYPPGTEGTRPEIYVQGNRNPYRISVDQKTGYLYWGEVGPDANDDLPQTRGSRGYDEINQAREAGFFGWPFFVGDNYAYRRYDYATGESGELYDPRNPVNDSPNNDGIRELPPARPAFIWYPYAESPEFPGMGTGGRNAMAGPVYHADMYPEETRLPGYYDGKLFIYEWVRNWIKVVTMDENGDFSKMEPFLEEATLNALIDMEVGPEGRIYLLEYGSAWYQKNDDSGLSFIHYNPGNRAPVVQPIMTDKTSGTLPLTITVTAEASDPENDELTYTWDKGNGETVQTSTPHAELTYQEAGDYSVSVEVSDPSGNSVTSAPVSVYAGNAAPEVTINIPGNTSFYFPGQPVRYSVSVEDPDDPDASEDLSSLFVSADYVEGADLAEASLGHQIMTEAIRGKTLVESMDCRSCHQTDAESVGPSYRAIAERYEDASDAESYLANKVIQGGSGVWGETMMPAHQDTSEADARRIVSWILSLDDEEEQARESLPAEGSVDPTLGEQPMPGGVLILSASYTDRGGPDVKPLTGETEVYLRNSSISLTRAGNLQGYTSTTSDGRFLMMVPGSEGSFSLEQTDLTGIGSVQLTTVAPEPLPGSYEFELRLGSPDGEVVAEGVVEPEEGRRASAEGEQQVAPKMTTMDVHYSGDGRLHDLYMVSRPVDESRTATLVLSGITFNPE